MRDLEVKKVLRYGDRNLIKLKRKPQRIADDSRVHYK